MSSFETPDSGDKDVHVNRVRDAQPIEQLPRFSARTGLDQVYTALLGIFCAAAFTQLVLFCNVPTIWVQRLPLTMFGIGLILSGAAHYSRRFNFPVVLPFAIIAGALIVLR